MTLHPLPSKSPLQEETVHLNLTMGKALNLGADLLQKDMLSLFSIPLPLPFTHQAATAVGILAPCYTGWPGVGCFSLLSPLSLLRGEAGMGR